MSLDSSDKYYICKDACTDDEVTSLEDPKICIAQDQCAGFIYEQHCVEKCPDGTFQENADSKQCFSKCTSEYPVYIKSDNFFVCRRTCPDDLPVTNNGQCVDECAGILNQKLECETECASFA